MNFLDHLIFSLFPVLIGEDSLQPLVTLTFHPFNFGYDKALITDRLNQVQEPMRLYQLFEVFEHKASSAILHWKDFSKVNLNLQLLCVVCNDQLLIKLFF